MRKVTCVVLIFIVFETCAIFNSAGASRGTGKRNLKAEENQNQPMVVGLLEEEDPDEYTNQESDVSGQPIGRWRSTGKALEPKWRDGDSVPLVPFHTVTISSKSPFRKKQNPDGDDSTRSFANSQRSSLWQSHRQEKGAVITDEYNYKTSEKPDQKINNPFRGREIRLSRRRKPPQFEDEEIRQTENYFNEAQDLYENSQTENKPFNNRLITSSQKENKPTIINQKENKLVANQKENKLVDNQKENKQIANQRENKLGANNQKENIHVSGNQKENKHVAGNQKENKHVSGNQKENKHVAGNQKENKPITSNEKENKPIANNQKENKSIIKTPKLPYNNNEYLEGVALRYRETFQNYPSEYELNEEEYQRPRPRKRRPPQNDEFVELKTSPVSFTDRNPTFSTVRSQRKQENNRRNNFIRTNHNRTVKTPERPSENSELKTLLKMQQVEGSSLSEILQRRNLTLSDLLQGKADVINLLKSKQVEDELEEELNSKAKTMEMMKISASSSIRLPVSAQETNVQENPNPLSSFRSTSTHAYQKVLPTQEVHENVHPTESMNPELPVSSIVTKDSLNLQKVKIIHDEDEIMEFSDFRVKNPTLNSSELNADDSSQDSESTLSIEHLLSPTMQPDVIESEENMDKFAEQSKERIQLENKIPHSEQEDENTSKEMSSFEVEYQNDGPQSKVTSTESAEDANHSLKNHRTILNPKAPLNRKTNSNQNTNSNQKTNSNQNTNSNHKSILNHNTDDIYYEMEPDARAEILELFNSGTSAKTLESLLKARNMSIEDLIALRQRGSSQVHLAEAAQNRENRVKLPKDLQESVKPLEVKLLKPDCPPTQEVKEFIEWMKEKELKKEPAREILHIKEFETLPPIWTDQFVNHFFAKKDNQESNSEIINSKTLNPKTINSEIEAMNLETENRETENLNPKTGDLDLETINAEINSEIGIDSEIRVDSEIEADAKMEADIEEADAKEADAKEADAEEADAEIETDSKIESNSEKGVNPEKKEINSKSSDTSDGFMDILSHFKSSRSFNNGGSEGISFYMSNDESSNFQEKKNNSVIPIEDGRVQEIVSDISNTFNNIFKLNTEEGNREEKRSISRVRTSIIVSGGILGVTIVVFLSIFIVCRVRQKKKYTYNNTFSRAVFQSPVLAARKLSNTSSLNTIMVNVVATSTTKRPEKPGCPETDDDYDLKSDIEHDSLDANDSWETIPDFMK